MYVLKNVQYSKSTVYFYEQCLDLRLHCLKVLLTTERMNLNIYYNLQDWIMICSYQ